MKVQLKSGFDECVGITRFVMNIIGIWPGRNLDYWYLRYRFFIPVFFMIFFINVPQTKMLTLVWGNLNLILEILTTADIMIGLACVKLLGIWFNKKDLRFLIIEIEKDWKTTEKNHQRAMWNNVRLGKSILSLYVLLAYATVIIYASGMLVLLNIHSKQMGYANISSSKPMFVNSKFFFETESSPIFEVIWICQFVAAILGVGAFTSFDGFFIFSILHLCAQLSNLQFELKTLTFKKQYNRQSFVQLLTTVVKRHIHLIRFTYFIEDNFNKVFLVQMICYSVTLCLQGYQLVISTAENLNTNLATLAFIVVFTVANIISLFMYCFVAEKLRTESENMYFAVYEMNWYELKPKESIMLLNMMYVTKSPLKITAGKFVSLSIEYFVKVLKTSAGYLSMLLAVRNRL